ncbi:hypothetical protein QUF64_01770 [Anaerolineales bacterium HSG6]|nr:hypothetical protein [Anaerolineales bacterium HSG6]MDM8531010.1 hypothetical protein [Anaerolineales bacterium HSG25]
MEYFDDPIMVNGSVTADGELDIDQLTWQNQTYSIISSGRQWDTDTGRHALVEAAGNIRFEVALERSSFAWRLKRVWRNQATA